MTDRYISEQALIDNLVKIQDLRTLSTKTVGEAIRNTPTADVEEVKHGRWHTARKTKLSKTVHCTVCDMDFYFKVKGQLNIDMCPYCPNCGAKMDKMNLSELPTERF